MTTPLIQRRKSPRRDARLTFSVPLLNIASAHENAPQDNPTLTGHTRDVSMEGLALFVPSIRFARRYLIGPEDNTLHFALHLPTRVINIAANVMHHRALNENEKDVGFIINGRVDIEATPTPYNQPGKDAAELPCLIGVLIQQMSEQDRVFYHAYLSILGLTLPYEELSDLTKLI